jgi:stage III sporulation protein AE
MRKRRVFSFFLIAVVILLTQTMMANASDVDLLNAVENKKSDTTDTSQMQGLLDNLNMDSVEHYLSKNEETKNISFLQLIKQLMTADKGNSIEQAGDYVGNLLFQEIRQNKRFLVIIIALAAAFALIKNFSNIFHNSYISELCFILVYIELMILLMKSFLIVNQLLGGTLGKVVDFMKALLPVFCMTMLFSGGTSTAAGFYEMAFFIIFIVQWVMLYLLAPLIQIYVVMQFLNYMLEGEKFTRMCELLEGAIQWGMKIIVTVVLGLNVVQSLINPAVDRLKLSSITKTVKMIPGVGNSVSALGEMLVGTGIVIKNSVGVAAMLVIVIIGLIPLVKIGVITFLYKLAAASVEPITDKRIAGSINGVFRGSLLASKLMLTSLFLFLITIAMITASSSFAAG